jgi:hypothetical protein
VVRWATDELPKSITVGITTATFQILALEHKLFGTVGGASFLTNPATGAPWNAFGYYKAWDSNTNANSDPLSEGSNKFVKSSALNIPVDTTPDTPPVVGGGGGGSAAPAPVDAIAPTITIPKKPKSSTTSKKFSLSFSASEAVTFQCKLDKGKFKSCKSPYKQTVKIGKHKLQITATDAAGNVSSVKTISWTVKKKG